LTAVSIPTGTYAYIYVPGKGGPPESAQAMARAVDAWEASRA